ncbi:MAG: sugar phosphate isomerase/epimerase family protein [Kiritimatiellia bacterium]|jgi:sugar phosphate isomerase/epimerase|nr:sugar phosphate isomerase/epimerase [Kiritimatiellia bacterium]MDD4172694.1 sugar phosphate isomerase/epimerase [Kiritimatiellia bacterium]MDX9793267.1 sugar phosphate isomerase/epimerase family protein [Kiritimatiellia bacterium]
MQHTVCAAAAVSTCAARAADRQGKILFGVCAGPDKAERLKAIGYDFIEGGVGGTFKPTMPDAEYEAELAKLKQSALPFRSCNGFIPSTYRLTGPETTHDTALEYAVTACRRADLLGVPCIVFGSGGARKLPDGFDASKGREQFIDFCSKLGDRIQDLKVTIVLEPLNKGETNLLNSVTEGIAYVDAIDRPRIQLLADFYHMMKEDEGPDAIRKAGARIRHCHIAELEGRKAPGTKGEDLSRYFKALHDIGYTGGVSCECGWPKENVEEAWKKALATMRQQAGV